MYNNIYGFYLQIVIPIVIQSRDLHTPVCRILLCGMKCASIAAGCIYPILVFFLKSVVYCDVYLMIEKEKKKLLSGSILEKKKSQ